MSDAQTADAAVESQLQVFLDTLRDSETYRQFIEATEQLQADPEATALVREYQQKQQRMEENGFDQSIMSDLQDLQTEISNNDIIQQQRTAETELIELLRETNEVISDSIGQEFAQSQGGGCC
jgi:cell fate (sporulation/competence/biofilm development) regulator YlbF (YheA/YmcA/DUF963 family)